MGFVILDLVLFCQVERLPAQSKMFQESPEILKELSKTKCVKPDQSGLDISRLGGIPQNKLTIGQK